MKKDKIYTSFTILKTTESEPELFLILEIIDKIFIEIYNWYFDNPDYILTWPRQLVLSRFYTTTIGKVRGFDLKKESNILKTNFDYWKQFLIYNYRVAYCGSHFITVDNNDQWTPESYIQFTDIQKKV